MAAKRRKRQHNKSTGRDYAAEYARYQGKPSQIKRRAKRNAARRKLMKKGRVRKGDGKDVDHVRGIGAGNGSKNLRVRSKSKNRGFKRTKKGKPIFGKRKTTRKKATTRRTTRRTTTRRTTTRRTTRRVTRRRSTRRR